MSDRYAGKPFLELVDAFVLDAIGHLHPDDDDALTAREPQFREMFGVDGSWREIVVTRMGFPEGMAGALHELWIKGRNSYVTKYRSDPVPREFAQGFIDTNFPH